MCWSLKRLAILIALLACPHVIGTTMHESEAVDHIAFHNSVDQNLAISRSPTPIFRFARRSTDQDSNDQEISEAQQKTSTDDSTDSSVGQKPTLDDVNYIKQKQTEYLDSKIPLLQNVADGDDLTPEKFQKAQNIIHEIRAGNALGILSVANRMRGAEIQKEEPSKDKLTIISQQAVKHLQAFEHDLQERIPDQFKLAAISGNLYSDPRARISVKATRHLTGSIKRFKLANERKKGMLEDYKSVQEDTSLTKLAKKRKLASIRKGAAQETYDSISEVVHSGLQLSIHPAQLMRAIGITRNGLQYSDTFPFERMPI